MKKHLIGLSNAIALANSDNNQNLYVLKASIAIDTNAPWLKIGVTGKWEGHGAGSFEMSQTVFEQMVANYENAGIDVVCDYEHQTLFGDTAPASGWIKKEPISLKVEGGELFAAIEWTDKAKAYIKAKEYRYLSPVFAPNTISQTDASNIGWTLHSVALTNKPFLEELGEVRLNKLTQIHHQKENETMTEAELQAIQDENKRLKEQNETLEADVKKHQDTQAEAKVDAAIAAKKLHPDQKESALKMCKENPSNFESFIGAAKPMIQKPGDDLFENKNNGKKDDGELTPEELKAATGGIQ